MDVHIKQTHPYEYSIYIYIHLHVLPEELVTDLLAGDEVNLMRPS